MNSFEESNSASVKVLDGSKSARRSQPLRDDVCHSFLAKTEYSDGIRHYSARKRHKRTVNCGLECSGRAALIPRRTLEKAHPRLLPSPPTFRSTRECPVHTWIWRGEERRIRRSTGDADEDDTGLEVWREAARARHAPRHVLPPLPPPLSAADKGWSV